MIGIQSAQFFTTTAEGDIPMKASRLVTAALVLAFAAPFAHAHKEGNFIVRAGAALVAPEESSSSVSAGGAKIAGSGATLGNNTQLGLTLGYMLTDNIGIELLAATPFKHRLGVKGVAAGVDGKLADIEHLPPTLSLQYYPMDAKSKWQPYVGAGVNYTMFFNEKLTAAQKANGFSKLKLSDSWGFAVQAGLDYMISDNVMINASVWRVDINTQATARLGAAKVKIDVDVDPWVYMIGVGYRF
jgi:outer membrane protein